MARIGFWLCGLAGRIGHTTLDCFIRFDKLACNSDWINNAKREILWERKYEKIRIKLENFCFFLEIKLAKKILEKKLAKHKPNCPISNVLTNIL